MSQSGYTPIQLYRTSTASAAPTAGNLADGELAINYNTADGKLFYKDSAGVVQVLATKGTASVGGSDTQVQYNSSGSLAGSANLTFNGTTLTANTLNLTNALGPSYGGTGLASYTIGDIIYASGATTLSKLADVATGNSLISGGVGAAPSWGKIGLTTHVSGTLPVANGGTNITSYTVGDLLYASGATTLSKLADVATGNSLISGGVGVAPSWGKVGLTTHVSGTLEVGNGGTGITSGTSGGVPYFSATNTIASSAALAANALVIGGGAGVAPATTTTGSGVLTALGNAANASNGFTTINGTATLTNKRIDPRVTSAASASSLTPDISAADQYCYTALAADLTINAPIGTPVDGDKLLFRILDNGTSRALSWNGTYTVIGVTLPTSTTISKMLYVGCIYNSANTRWDVVAVTTQA